MKIVSYNINGIRAALRKGLDEWLIATSPDIVCLQEIKAREEQFDTTVFTDLGYHCYWYSAQKPGYSGTAILSKIKPESVSYGMNHESYDNEGRVIRTDFKTFSIISVYMPSGSSGDLRQEFKMTFLDDFRNYITELSQQIPHLIIAGDYNICHQAIDIHNPQRNQKTSGFLPEEREWLTSFMNVGFIDTFRHFNQDPHHYSWWSYRANARAKNLGWRIDYLLASSSMKSRLSRAAILSQAKHSDHCPVLLELS
ncbi:exodeoxyribonuclease III [Flavobacteriales bacterium]|nr:exodeoxyribonuclease III [Flavobacteriales bacterium]